MEEFRFHMTLTGRLAAERREPVLTMLRDTITQIADISEMAAEETGKQA